MKRSDTEKAQVVEMSRRGLRVSEISRLLGYPQSTVSTILTDARKAAATNTLPNIGLKILKKKTVHKKQTKAQKWPQSKALQKRPQLTKVGQKKVKKGLQKRAMVKTAAPEKRSQRRTEAEKARVVKLSNKGWTMKMIAQLMNIPLGTIYYIIRKRRQEAEAAAGASPAENEQVSTQRKVETETDNHQTAKDGAEMVSHTAKMVGALKMKIKAVPGDTPPKKQEGVQAEPQKPHLQSTQMLKEWTQTTLDFTNQGEQHPRRAKVLGTLKRIHTDATGQRIQIPLKTPIPMTKVAVQTLSNVPRPYRRYPLKMRMEVMRRFKLGENVTDIGKDLGIHRVTALGMCRSKVLKRLVHCPAVRNQKRLVNRVAVRDSKKKGVQVRMAAVDGGGSVDKGVDEGVAFARDVKEEVEVGVEEAVEDVIDDSMVGVSAKSVVTENMERLLKMWIDGQINRGCVVSDAAIQTKAVSLWRFVYDGLTPEEASGVGRVFMASAAWLMQFKEAAGLYTLPHPSPMSLPMSPQATPAGVGVGVAAAAYQRGGEGRGGNGLPSQRMGKGAAKKFSSPLRARMELGGYTASQVISMAETRLCWKSLPRNSVIALDSFTRQGLRASRDSFSLLLGANMTGDLKLKPLLVYQQEKPSSLAGYIKEQLPVVWRAHHKARLTAALCQNYVVEYVSQRCREYAAQCGLPNRFLLVVEAGTAHPPSMDDWVENIEVLFLPPNNNGYNAIDATDAAAMTALGTQPMGRGISTFKLCYLRRIFEQLVRETNTGGNDYLSLVCGFWRTYSIKKALSNIKMAWDDVPPSTLSAAWQDIWPDCVNTSLTPTMQRLSREVSEDAVASLAHQAGFVLVTEQNVRDWKDSHDLDPHINGSTNHITEHQHEEEEVEDESNFVKTLDVRSLSHALNILEDTVAMLETNDPNATRSCEARQLIEAGVKGYRELLAVKRRKAENSTFYSAHHHRQ